MPNGILHEEQTVSINTITLDGLFVDLSKDRSINLNLGGSIEGGS